MPGNTVEEGSSSNRYTILGKLAGGGMADIFLAKSFSEGGVERFVVLKRVLAERSRDPHFAKMFLDEARLAAQLQHPNIAQVHDIGRLGESYFFTMEYVHGEDLRSIATTLGKLNLPMPIPFALHVAAGALAALNHAHERRSPAGKRLDVVHRDVSPSNVMVSYEGTVKLLDFGVAKAAQNDVETRAGTVKGKASYLSPEQTSGAPVDRRSDIFALGIVLWEMLAGTRLFRRENDFVSMVAIATEDVPPPSVHRALAPELDHIVLTALAKEPSRRFATAADMLEAIENFAAREGHVLSATSASKFMRERFGSPPEPWLELLGQIDSEVTVHGEAINELNSPEDPDEPETTRLVRGKPRDTNARKLIEEQLRQAPPIHRAPTLPPHPPRPNHGTTPPPVVQLVPPSGPRPQHRTTPPPVMHAPPGATRSHPNSEPPPMVRLTPPPETAPRPQHGSTPPPVIQLVPPPGTGPQPYTRARNDSAQVPLAGQPYPPGYLHPGVQHVPQDTVDWLRSGLPGGAPAATPSPHGPAHQPPRQLRELPKKDLRMSIVLGVAITMIVLGIVIAVALGSK